MLLLAANLKRKEERKRGLLNGHDQTLHSAGKLESIKHKPSILEV